MKLKVSWASSRNRRKENQDNLSIGEQAAFPEGIEERHISGQVLMDTRNEVLFAAADGLGGCANGKYAAARCLEVLRESFYSFYNTATETEAEEQTALCEPPHTCTTGESPLPVLRPVSQLLPLRAASLEEEAEPAPSRLMAAAMEARDALAETYRYVDGGVRCVQSRCAQTERWNGFRLAIVASGCYTAANLLSSIIRWITAIISIKRLDYPRIQERKTFC